LSDVRGAGSPGLDSLGVFGLLVCRSVFSRLLPSAESRIDLSHSHMQRLKYLGQAIIHLIKQAWLLPRRKRVQTILNEREVERLDRIRNPSKYLGK